MDLKRLIIPGRHPGRLTAVITLIVIALTPFFIARDLQAVELIGPVAVITWAVCLGVFVLCQLLAGRVENGLWAGYLFMLLAVVWLLLGTGLALLLLIVGALLAERLRGLQSITRLIDGEASAGGPLWLEQAWIRFVILSLPLLLMAVLYALLHGDHLRVRPQWSQPLELMAVLGTLLAGLLLTQVIGATVAGPHAQRHVLWRPDQRYRLPGEAVTLAIIVPLALIQQQVGWLAFVVFLLGTGLQAFRYRQIAHAQRTLLDRVQELSMLRSMGQDISANLMLDDVLLSAYDWVSQITQVNAFAIALYDENRNVVEFPLAMQAGERVHWAAIPIEREPILSVMLDKRRLLRVDLRRASKQEPLPYDLPTDADYRYGLCVPLAAVNRILGMMVIINGDARPIDARPEIPALTAIASQASLALRNATLYYRSVSLADKLTRINQSVQDIMFNLNQDEALRVACQTAIAVAGAQRAAIFLTVEDDDRNADQARLVEQVGLNPAHVALYDGPIHRPAVMNVRSHVVADVDELDERDALRELAAVGGFRALAEIPLRSGNTVIGMLTVFYDQPHNLDRAETELLEALAYQVSSALDNAEMLNALGMYANEQAQLSHLSRITTASLDIEVMIENIISVLAQVHPMGQVAIALLTDDAWLEIYGLPDTPVFGVAVGSVPELARIQDDAPQILRVFYRRDPPDGQLSPQLAELMQRYGVGTLAVLPLVAAGRLRGFVLLGDSGERVFSDREWRLVELASNQVAMQVHNALLHRDTEEALNRRLQQLSAIEDLARQISNSLNLDRLVHNVLEAVIRITQASEALLALRTSSGAVRVIGQVYQAGEWRQFDRAQPPHDALVRQLLDEGESLHLTGQPSMILRAGAGLARTDDGNGAVYTLLGVPLNLEGRTVGALIAQSRLRSAFNEEQIDFIHSLAGHAVISIQNAWMLQERQGQIAQLNQLRDLSLWLSIDSDHDSVVDGVLQTVLSISQGRAAIWYERDPATDRLRQRAALRRSGEVVRQPGISVPDVVLRELQRGQTVAVGDVRQHPACASLVGVGGFIDDGDSDGAGYASLLAVPIKRHTRIDEAICVLFRHSRGGLETERNALELLAIQAAGHLDNALLYGQISTNNSRMRAILDATRDGIVLLDPNGCLVEANVSAESILGIEIDEYRGQHFAEYLLNDTEIHHSTDPAEGDSLLDMVRILRLNPERTLNPRNPLVLSRDGQLRYIEWASSLVEDGRSGTMGRLLTFRDVTEQHMLEAYRDEIFKMVVHDLRSPVANMISSLGLVQEDMQGLQGEDMHRSLGIAVSSAERLLKLVDSLLEIAKLEQRRLPMNWTITAVEPIIRAALDEITPATSEAQITLEDDIAPDLPPVRIDTEQIGRVLLNLLVNAVHYTPNGGTIQVTARRVGSKVRVQVADSGSGIPPQDIERVFEKFHQAQGTRQHRGGKGTGLGLTFCWLSLQAHGESIWVEPDGPLSGACFVFTLPVAPG